MSTTGSRGAVFGIQRRPFRALLGLFLRLELRSQAYASATGARATDVIPPLYWVIVQFLLTSMLVSLLLFMRVNVAFFALANLAVTLLLVFSALVVEFHEAVLDPSDTEILGPRPIEARTYAAARGSTLVAYVLLMTGTLSIFPAILGAGLRDSGPLFAVAYPIAAALVGIAAAAIVVLLYLVFRGDRWMSAARQGLAWVQIIAVLAAFYGGQFMLRSASGGVEHFAAAPPSWLWHLPFAPLATFVAAATRGEVGPAAFLLAASSAVVAGLSAWAGLRLTHRWSQLSRQPPLTSSEVVEVADPFDSARGGRVGWPWRGVLVDRAEAAGFRLATTVARRDADLAARIWPQLGTVVAVLGVAYLTDQLRDPWRDRGPGTAFVYAIASVLASTVPSLLVHLGSSRQHQAAWLFESAPVRLRSVNRGARLALYPRFIGPLMFGVFAVFTLGFGRPDTALLECVWLLAVAEAVAAFTAPALMRDAPLGRPVVRGASMGKASLYGALAGFGVATLGGFRYAAGPALLLQAVLLAATLGAVVFARAREVRRGR